MHHGVLFRRWRRSPHPASDKQACRTSGGVCEADSTNRVRRATSLWLRKYDARCCIIKNQICCSMHHGVLFRRWRRSPHPASDKQACRTSGGVCEADSTNRARRAAPLQLRKYDARCCIIFTEGYRSGHNEAVLKTVWQQCHVGSNPTPSAKSPEFSGLF